MGLAVAATMMAGLAFASIAEARPHGFHGHRGHGFQSRPHCRTFHDHGRRERVCQ